MSEGAGMPLSEASLDQYLEYRETLYGKSEKKPTTPGKKD
jgi:hypothetical protein